MKSLITFLSISEDCGLIEIGDYFKKIIPNAQYKYSRKGEFETMNEAHKYKVRNRNSFLKVQIMDEDGQYDDILLKMIKTYLDCKEYFDSISHISDFYLDFFDDCDYSLSVEFSHEVLSLLGKLGMSLPITCHSVKVDKMDEATDNVFKR